MENKKFLDEIKKIKINSTDEYYTPVELYECILDYCIENYNLKNKKIVRPFIPYGDYQAYKYSKNDVVIDNPPFSIEREIINFYNKHNIKFFLFCSGLNAINYLNNYCGTKKNCIIITYSTIQYEKNTKPVNTCFVTNLESGGIKISKTLSDKLKKFTVRVNKCENVIFPKVWVNSARLQKYSKLFDFKIEDDECIKYDKIENFGKSFGGGAFITEEKAKQLEEKFIAETEKISKKIELNNLEKNIVLNIKEINKNVEQNYQIKIKL